MKSNYHKTSVSVPCLNVDVFIKKIKHHTIGFKNSQQIQPDYTIKNLIC